VCRVRIERIVAYLFQLNRPENTDVTAEVSVIPVFPHVLVHVDLRRSVFAAHHARYLRCRARGRADRMKLEMFVESLLDGARIRAHLAPIFLSFIPG